MKGWVGWILLALSLGVALQGYRNAQPDALTEDLSKSAACEGSPGCTRMADRPGVVSTDIVGRYYEWITSDGPMKVTCRRRLVFAGYWECHAEPGRVPR